MKTLTQPAAFVPSGDPVKKLLPWCGALGHTVVLAAPSDSDHAKPYGGWHALCEASSVKYVMDLFKPGMRVFQKSGKRVRGGAIREQWNDVTSSVGITKQTSTQRQDENHR